MNRLYGCRVYLDTNVFIYSVEGFPKYASIAAKVLAGADALQFQAVTSELTLAELLVHPIRKSDSRAVAAYETMLQSRLGLDVHPITKGVLRRSAEFRAEFGSRLPDAIHVATAILTGADFVITADRSMRAPRDITVIALDDLNTSETE